MWELVVKKKPLFSGVVGAPAFTGTGTDDLMVIGPSFFAATRSYRIEIDSTSETFRWSNDNGVSWEAEDIDVGYAVGTYYELINAEHEREGLKIKFGVRSGHVNGDLWDIVTTGDVVAASETAVSPVIINSGAEELIISGEYVKGTEDGLILYVKMPLEYTDTVQQRFGRNIDTGDGGLIYKPEYFKLEASANYKYRVNVSGVPFYQLYQIRSGAVAADGLFTAFADTFKILR